MSVTPGDACRCCRSVDEPVTDRPIAGSVGAGGKNGKDDVLTIQQMLNALSPAEGGPSPTLAEDGLIGPKTQAAITKYQKSALGWSDGRIDVAGPTIRALTQYIVDSPTVPYGKLGAPPASGGSKVAPAPSDPAVAVAGASSVLKARQCINVLEPRLHTLRWRLTRAAPKSPMLELLNKHFCTGPQVVTPADLGWIQTVLQDIHLYIARVNAFGKMPVSNVILYDPAPTDTVIAYTVRGGAKMSTQQVQLYKDKGVMKKFPGQSIWLTPIFEDQPSYEKHWTVLHEFAHFVGGRDGFMSAVHDHSYAFDAKFVLLSKFQKLHNAESLSLFFLEWCIGTEAMLKLPRMSVVKDFYAEFPRVSPDGQIVTS